MFSIYIITRLSTLIALSWVIFIFSCVALLIGWVGSIIEDVGSYVWQKFKKVQRAAITPFIITLVMVLITPTPKQAIIAWAGGKAIEYVETHESIQETPDKIAKLTNTYIETLTKQLEEKMEKSDKGKVE